MGVCMWVREAWLVGCSVCGRLNKVGVCVLRRFEVFVWINERVLVLISQKRYSTQSALF